jgi:threonine dehydrogenase-like Zn-dependent dehydrogenase
MRAMVLRGKELAVEEVPTPAPGPMQVLARVRACGICGSDLHAARYMEDMIAASKASGRTAWDTLDITRGIIMGHEFVAEVVQLGEGSEAFASAGDRVTSVPAIPWQEAPNGFLSIGYSPEIPGAYGEYILMGAPMLLKVPDNVTDEVAATTEPCAVGLHAVRHARMQPGEHAVIMGAGPIGLMTLLWLKKEGVQHVTVSDFAPSRRALATQLGADLVVNPAEQDLAAAIIEAGGAAAPVVFECVGVQGTLEQSMELVARLGRVVVVGVCMLDDTIKPMVGINKQLTLQFVLGYTPAEYAEALASLADGSIDTAPMVTRRVALDELPEAFVALADPDDCKVVFVPGT